jgi:hypothetical protein
MMFDQASKYGISYDHALPYVAACVIARDCHMIASESRRGTARHADQDYQADG